MDAREPRPYSMQVRRPGDEPCKPSWRTTQPVPTSLQGKWLLPTGDRGKTWGTNDAALRPGGPLPAYQSSDSRQNAIAAGFSRKLGNQPQQLEPNAHTVRPPYAVWTPAPEHKWTHPLGQSSISPITPAPPTAPFTAIERSQAMKYPAYLVRK